MGNIAFLSLFAFLLPSLGATDENANMSMKIDPVTRYIHVSYSVPGDAPDEIAVSCSWSPGGDAKWQPAKVMPLISETGLNLAADAEWKEWVQQGKVIERRAKGLVRTVVFNPYPEAQKDGKVDVDFRVEIKAPGGDAALSTQQLHVQADNSDVVFVEDWSKVIQQDAITSDKEVKGRQWQYRSGVDATFGTDLFGTSSEDFPLPALTYPLALRGSYAIFVCTQPHEGAQMRLTGDERSDTLSSRRICEEVFWRWAKMDRQHLVLKQPHGYKGYSSGEVDYIKLVPLTAEQAKTLDDQFGEPDKIVGGYFEPYSWAFAEDVKETLQHREPLVAFREARMNIVDMQISRFGMKSVYEARATDQLLYATIGDPVEGDAAPKTNNTGRMQQYTNTLDAELRYARELGMEAHANFGATNCYPGTPLQGDFSKQHPDWVAGHALRYAVPEVRDYMLGMVREALEIGAPGISIDFCRYPEGIDSAETCNTFMKSLRQLADEFSAKRNAHVPVLVRFPGTGVRRCDFFGYATWAREGWVDYLCPSNIQGRHHHIDVASYLDAVKGSKTKLLPCIDGLSWGPDMPGPFLWRVAQVYKAGVDGVYVYQADGRILGWPGDRRCMRMLASSKAIEQWWAEDARTRPARSKGIYLSRPEAPGGAYSPYERLRPWVEGVEMGAMEIYLDDKLVTACPGPPYLLGTENYESDKVIPPGEHRLKVRAKDGDGWLEQTFSVKCTG